MISQIELIAAIVKNIERQGHKSLCPRQLNAIIAAANQIIAECQNPPVSATPGMGLPAWLASDDTGLSSSYMANVLNGFAGAYAHPHDLDDFGRCSRLLDAVPEFRDRLDEMRSKSKQWGNLVSRWNEIETLIKNGQQAEANKIVMDAVR